MFSSATLKFYVHPFICSFYLCFVLLINDNLYFSGINIVAIAESIHLSESLTDKLRHGGSNVTGYLAIAYALYKIATPLRYTITLGKILLCLSYCCYISYKKMNL